MQMGLAGLPLWALATNTNQACLVTGILRDYWVYSSKALAEGSFNQLIHLKSNTMCLPCIGFRKNISFCLIDDAKAFVWITTNCGKFLETGLPDHLICLLRKLQAGQEATARTTHGTTDWSKIGKAVCQGCVLSPCLFNLYAEYIMRNAKLDKAQAGIKISRRNTNDLRYADDITLMAENEEELKSLLMKTKRRVKKLA